MLRVTRRKFLYLVGVAAVAGIMSYVYKDLRSSGGKRTLRVYNYSYYIDPKVIDMFEEEYGVNVVYDEYEAAEEAWGKIQAGGGGYDLIVLADSYVHQAVEKGLIKTIDHARLENYGNIDPVFEDNPFDPGLRHAIPYMWGTTGIGYLGSRCGKEITGWAQLFDTQGFLPRHSGKVSMLDEFGEVVQAAMIHLGLDFTDPRSWIDHRDEVVSLLRSQKSFLAGYYGASQYVPGLAKGSLDAAQAWSGDVLTAQEDNDDVEYLIPEEGTWRWMDMMVIPRDSRNVDLAYLWIDYMLRPDIAARNVAYVYYPASVRKELVASELSRLASGLGVDPEEIMENPAVYPPRGKADKFSPVYTREMLDALSDIESRVRAP